MASYLVSRFTDTPLSAERLRSLLNTAWMGTRLEVYDELDSTNTTALAQARRGAPHGTVIVSETQHAGRGRLGRSWHSPPGVNLYCSIVLRHPPQSAGLSWISLMAGVAVCEALHPRVACSVALKWPNDLVVGSRKVGGILCESVSHRMPDWIAVIGLGLNVNLERHQLPPDLREIATSLFMETGQHGDRHELLASILTHLECFYDRLRDGNLAELKNRYLQYCRTIGHEVRVQYADGTALYGVAVDVGWNGALLVRVPFSQTLGMTTERSPSFVEVQAGDILHLREHPLSTPYPDMPLENRSF
ncbi:MAG: biotin--[acetyl-CoA-carboxylase] ligase [Nitrospirae bacterium]|nr:MAG: biotin--[acetyl-CoA-carboxylase] ligase [Nitrospirota bacterium]